MSDEVDETEIRVRVRRPRAARAVNGERAAVLRSYAQSLKDHPVTASWTIADVLADIEDFAQQVERGER